VTDCHLKVPDSLEVIANTAIELPNPMLVRLGFSVTRIHVGLIDGCNDVLL
jgi:hypothetical protein